MRKGLPIIAAILTACGAAVTTADNAADANQGSRRAKQTRPPAEDPAIRQAREMEAAIEGGGMPGCFNPSLRGRERAVAERLGGVPCAGASGAAAGASARGGQSFAGNWSGIFQGGQVDAEISPRGGNRFHVELTTSNPETSCGGGMSGNGSATGNRLSISDTLVLGDTGNASCTMHLTRQGDRLSLNGVGDCHYWSGMSCGMGGTLRLQGVTRR